MYLRLTFLIFGLCLVVGCAKLPQAELDRARSQVAKAYASGAKILAPLEYQAASGALHDAELLVHRGRYAQAREALHLAQLQASQALGMSQTKGVLLEAQRQADIEAGKAKEKARKLQKKQLLVPKSATPLPATEIVLLDQVVVLAGETLFSLAERKDIYADSQLWPLLYKANRDQIKDPLQIFKGQIFTIPHDKTEQERAAARKEASESGLF